MTPIQQPTVGDCFDALTEAIEEAKGRHPSSRAAGCGQCVADGRGRFTPCGQHRHYALQRVYHGTSTYGPASVDVTESVVLTGEVIASWPLTPVVCGAPMQWGFAGTGPAVLSEAVLIDAMGEQPTALMTLAFVNDVVSKLDTGTDLEFTKGQVIEWYADYIGHKGGASKPRRAIDTEIQTALDPMRGADGWRI